MIKTTARCSIEERDLINKTARNQSLLTNAFLEKCLDEFLPLKEAPIIDKNIDRQLGRINVNLTDELNDKILDNIEKISTKYRKVSKWEILLVCGLKGCEGA